MRRRSTLCLCLLALVMLAAPAHARKGGDKKSSGQDDKRVQAETLYAEGRYAEALPLLEELDAAGLATGPLLYRLTYCQRKNGDAAASDATERRALETLETEMKTAKDLEVPFYLSNIYRNTGRIAEANGVAETTTARFEAGEIPAPRTGMDMFQLGKLYADQKKDDAAAEWYTKAVDSLTADDQAGGPYVRWASRFLAERAYGRKDYDAAQRYYTTLIDAGEGEGADLEHWAMSLSRVGMFPECEKAWKLVEASGPPDPNRAVYLARLCKLSSTIRESSFTSPSGKPWTELTQEELETLMKDSAAEANATYAEAEEAVDPSREERRAFRKRLKDIKAVFVPAALEYALRGLEIRQTSFFGGYARLILHRDAWNPTWNVDEAAAETDADEDTDEDED